MNTFSVQQISKFLAFTVGPNAPFISMDDLNSIPLQNNNNKNILFFKKTILDIFQSEIKSYNIVNGENIGLLLSGGIDSTLLLDLISKKFNKSKIYTYTLAYSIDDTHLEYTRKISELYNTVHKEIIYDLESNLFDVFDEVYNDGYDLEGEDSLIMNHILSKEVKKDCNIVFSGFGLDYVFAGMDLFRNSYMEDLYSRGLIDKSYIFNALGGNKYYLKYILDKIDSDLGKEFFIKYGEYYGDVLKNDLEDYSKNDFIKSIGTIRSDISELKKQIFTIISTSLSNRYNPYNLPYEKKGIKHFNPFGSKEVITKIISLNIPDNFLYNPFTKEKKYIIREITKEQIGKELFDNLHSGTVLKYSKAFLSNKDKIISLINDNKELLSTYYKDDFLDNISKVLDDSMWYENTLKILLMLQLLYYNKYNK